MSFDPNLLRHVDDIIEGRVAEVTSDPEGNVVMVYRSGTVIRFPPGKPPPPPAASASASATLPTKQAPQEPPLLPVDRPEMEIEQLGIPPQPKTEAGVPLNIGPVAPVRGGIFDIPRYPNAAHKRWRPKTLP